MTKVPPTLEESIGSIVVRNDIITVAPIAGLFAAFGEERSEPQYGDVIPKLWHGLFCTAKTPRSKLGVDGLPRTEEILPSLAEYPNKLFGGARYRFLKPLKIGDKIKKESEVISFEVKQGRSGKFVFGVLQHRIYNDRGLCLVEDNDIIFRPSTAKMTEKKRGAQPPLPNGSIRSDNSLAIWSVNISLDPVLMFRHSALTFNSHRIHYDRDYVREKGYPGLVVQGSLIARLMLFHFFKRQPDYDIKTFAFRALRPIYDNGDIKIEATCCNENIEILAVNIIDETCISAKIS